MPQINNGKSPPWVAGEIVTAAGLNGMIDSATLDPSAITSQSDFPTLTGNEYELIVDPLTGLLKKTQLKNLLDAGLALTTPTITGGVSGGTGQQLQISSLEGLLIVNGDTSSANTGVELRSTGGNLQINATNSTFGHGNGLITVSSGSSGIDFLSSGTGTARFAQRAVFNTTSAIKIPVGTTVQRPTTPATGDFRFNSTTNDAEVYDGSAWESFNPVTSSALTANGFIKLANGLILQWGTSAVGMANYSEQTINFPTAFATACFSVQITAKTATVMTSGAAGYENGIKLNGNPTTTSFSVYCNWAGNLAGGIVYPTWFAIGI